MFSSRSRHRGRGTEFGVLLLVYNLISSNEYTPPVTLGTILLQVAVYLGYFPSLDQYTIHSNCIIPYRIWHYGEWYRMIAGSVIHGSDMHLYYNMISFLWKGRRLERLLGTPRFLILLVYLTFATAGIMILLSVGIEDFMHVYTYGLMHQCAVGFSGVIFALKVITNYYYPNADAAIMGIIPIPSKYACWAELLLIHLLVPNASFVGHLAGIIAGLLYVNSPTSLLDSSSTQQHRHPSRHSGARFFGSGTTGSHYRYPEDEHYDGFTGGLSEEEQLRRAMWESRRSYTYTAPRPSAPPPYDYR